MATMTTSVPEPVKDWIESQVSQGRYASTSDYLKELVRRDLEWAESQKQLTISGRSSRRRGPGLERQDICRDFG